MKQKQFLALLNPLEPKLFGFAYRMLRNEEGVKEAMQELRFRLWKKRKDLNTNKNIPAYCFRMMNNICIDTIRHNKKMINSSQSPYDEMEQSSWNEAENSISRMRRKQGSIS
ncbi:MAG: sigma-70 family RNA polymerase sigma factor, partial [Bacteroidetes bacterium]|nr:sigma-70 family RNA polymerase sigma factor [Bacteroidota bacterium]